MEITLSQVVEAARQRRAAVTAEGGGYIVLLALQQLAASPRQVTAELVGLTAAGEIELGPSPAAPAREVETQLRQLLGALLSLPQSAPPALKATGERAAVGDLAALEAELTAALIPFNHSAARRTLARLFRETQKATRAAVASADLDEREASAPLSGAVGPFSSETPPSSSRAGVTSPSLAAPLRAVTPLPAAAPLRAVTPLPAATPLRAVTPLPAVQSMQPIASLPPATPPPPIAVAAPELEIDVEIILSEGEARVDETVATEADAPLPGAIGRAGEVLLASAVAADDAGAPRSQELRDDVIPAAGVSAAAVAPTSPRATLPEVALADDGDIVDIEVDELEELDELLTAEVTPAELRFTSLSSAPLIMEADDETFVESPLPDSSGLPSYAEPEPPPHRSDLRDLLDGYLSHTRCEQQMTADLRRMIGLEPWRTPGAAVHRTELGR